MKNEALTTAKIAKNDEFYTQFHDIENEVNGYTDYNPDVFRGKTILCPCDDPQTSQFTKYFALKFQFLGLKKLICTSYAADSKKLPWEPTLFEQNSPQFDASKTASKGKVFILERDITRDGRINDADIEWHYLDGDGSFDSPEVCALRDEADIIITNPPFSKFREFLGWIMGTRDVGTAFQAVHNFGQPERLSLQDNNISSRRDSLSGCPQMRVQTDSLKGCPYGGGKQFLIIGNMNAITYKEVFPLIKENKMWLGTKSNMSLIFKTPYANTAESNRKYVASRGYDPDENYIATPAVCWFTNLQHGRRHQPLRFNTMQENLDHNRHMRGKTSYDHYDNYDALDVPFTDAIPVDYDGVMGVPISFLDKYCPEQFEIIGLIAGNIRGLAGIPTSTGKDGPYIDGKLRYGRILIRFRR